MFHLAAGMRRNHSGATAPKREDPHAPAAGVHLDSRRNAFKLTRTRRTGKFCQVAPVPAEKPELVRV